MKLASDRKKNNNKIWGVWIPFYATNGAALINKTEDLWLMVFF